MAAAAAKPINRYATAYDSFRATYSDFADRNDLPSHADKGEGAKNTWNFLAGVLPDDSHGKKTYEQINRIITVEEDKEFVELLEKIIFAARKDVARASRGTKPLEEAGAGAGAAAACSIAPSPFLSAPRATARLEDESSPYKDMLNLFMKRFPNYQLLIASYADRYKECWEILSQTLPKSSSERDMLNSLNQILLESATDLEAFQFNLAIFISREELNSSVTRAVRAEAVSTVAAADPSENDRCKVKLALFKIMVPNYNLLITSYAEHYQDCWEALRKSELNESQREIFEMLDKGTVKFKTEAEHALLREKGLEKSWAESQRELFNILDKFTIEGLTEDEFFTIGSAIFSLGEKERKVATIFVGVDEEIKGVTLAPGT